MFQGKMWRFPEMGISLNHQNLIGFFILNHRFGDPPFMETPMWGKTHGKKPYVIFRGANMWWNKWLLAKFEGHRWVFLWVRYFYVVNGLHFDGVTDLNMGKWLVGYGQGWWVCGVKRRVPPNHPFFSWHFHYKPSILGYVMGIPIYGSPHISMWLSWNINLGWLTDE